MSLYMVVEIEVKDPELYEEYVEKVYDIVTKYGGKYLVRGGSITPTSTSWIPDRLIIIEFQNKKQVKDCFQSSEYLELAPLREKSTLSKTILVEGYEA